MLARSLHICTTYCRAPNYATGNKGLNSWNSIVALRELLAAFPRCSVPESSLPAITPYLKDKVVSVPSFLLSYLGFGCDLYESLSPLAAVD